MTTSAPWWAEAPISQKPRIRWLVVFPRPAHLTVGLSKRVDAPLPKVGSARSSAGLIVATNPAAELPVAPSFEGPGELLGHAARVGPGGSVDLARAPTGVARDALGPAITQARGAFGTKLPGATKEDAAAVPLWRRLAYVLRPPASLYLTERSPVEWPASFFSYQLDGIAALLSAEALLLADDMGLGKTIQAIAALRILTLQGRLERCLLVVPAGLLVQWRRAIYRWAPELRLSTVHGPQTERAWQWASPAHIYLTSYETLREDFTSNPQCPPRRTLWDTVVLDEAQRIKNRDAEISRKCKLLPRRRAWALTGTPLENRVDDVASILEFVAPLEQGSSPERLFPGPALLSRHRAVQLRRKKADVLPQLPPKSVTEVTLALEGPQRETYDRAEREGILRLRAQGDEVRIENVLELILRLKQVCNFCPASGRSAKLEDLAERLETLTAEGHRALVFTQFTDERHGASAVAARLSQFQPLIYTGALSAAEKDSVIAEFRRNSDRKVLVLSLRAGGQGLNLQEASYVFHFDRWWNPAVEHQAEDRSHRMGQEFPVNVFKYLCEDTIEERIDEILQRKQALFDELVDDVSIDLRSALTAEELFGLFGLVPSGGPKTGGQRTAAHDYASMSGIDFEHYVKGLLERRGWQVEITPPGRDGGIDLIARSVDTLGLETVVYIQCKNTTAPVGVDVVREMTGVLATKESGARAIVVCPSGFSDDAIRFARRLRIELWDRHMLFKQEAT